MIRVLVALATLLWASQAFGASPVIPSTYDLPIAAAARAWMPDVPWKLYKAQLYQESRLDPAAQSPVGAAGLAQFMPSTWAEVMKAMGAGTQDRRLAAPSIEAGAFYMAKLRRNWSAPRPWQDKHRLALASYNAGLGSILDAQAACAGAALYDAIMACLPQITGRHAAETIGYAPAIFKWWAQLEATR